MSYFGVSPIASTDNATAAALGVGGTYTGSWEAAPRSMVLVQSFADTSGTLFFDFSINGVNADSTFPVSGFATVANIPTVQPSAVNGRYFRVRYVNGSVAQTEFRLGAFWGDASNFYAPLNQPYSLSSAAIITRSPWTWLDVSRGLASGLDSIKKFGRNSSVGTSFESICLGGIYQTPQTATTLRVKAGGNANDTAAGSGARSIILDGLDENFDPVSEEVVTAGALASASTAATFTRLFRVKVGDSGTYAGVAAGSHSGDVVIENTGGTDDWATIDSTDFSKSQSEIGAYTVPANKTGYVKLRDLSIDSGKTIDLVFFSRENADQTSPPYSPMRAQSVVSGVSGGSIETFGSVDVPFGPYIGPTDIGFMGKVSAGSASVSIEFEIFIVDE
jgi:hypothetical protein